MPNYAASLVLEGPYSEQAAVESARRLRTAAGGASSFGLVFFSRDYSAHWEEFSEILRLEGHISELVGCTASGLIGSGREVENAQGFSLVSFRVPGSRVTAHAISGHDYEESTGPAYWQMHTGLTETKGWIMVANPFGMPVDGLLQEWNDAYPGVPVIGALASGGMSEDDLAVFLNGSEVEGAVAISVDGAVEFSAIVCQGCRPIGEPLTVTRAESNVIYSLGSRPAYEMLELAYEALPDQDKANARGNLFAGLATNEYVEDFKSGDFLVRNILGADPQSGAVVIGGWPRVGQTVQYQFRDPISADADMRAVLSQQTVERSQLLGSVLFSCAGRGEAFFRTPNHDAVLMAQRFGGHPCGGFFCGGEIGPVCGHNSLHSYAAVSALILSQEPLLND